MFCSLVYAARPTAPRPRGRPRGSTRVPDSRLVRVALSPRHVEVLARYADEAGLGAGPPPGQVLRHILDALADAGR